MMQPPTPIPAAPPALLTAALIRRHFLPIGARTLARWISSGQFPRPDLAIGGKSRFWRRETVQKWIDAQAQTPADLAVRP